MLREIIFTKDGSHTVSIPEMGVTYHSLHGAIQESVHVFIEAGFRYIPRQPLPLRVFEMGFGTGLNALLTLADADKQQQPVHYTAIELFPIPKAQAISLNYCALAGYQHLKPVFEQLHASEWETNSPITKYFTLLKSRLNLLELEQTEPFRLIYFDAFAPAAQPELWTKEVFMKLYNQLEPGGILVTYCSKGEVRRAMQSAGFRIEKIPGPPGKKEMVRAIK